MQASSRSRETGASYAARRGHTPQLSISDDNHHVTEVLGYMYGDNDSYGRRESRPPSYLSSPLSESMQHSEPTTGQNSTKSPSSRTTARRRMSGDQSRARANAQGRPAPAAMNNSYERENGPLSPSSMRDRTPSDTANSSFPLNDIDYESSPAAVAQELSNLQALRRMSMDVTAPGDPDLPSANGNVVMPAVAPSASDDEDDTSRLFWVPARLHPELAPKEFKSFLESKAEQIKRRSGELSSFAAQGSAQRQNSLGSGSGTGLTRKKSMLSRQIDNSNGRGADGYQDGAERLERKRSLNQKPSKDPNLQELEALVTDPTKLQRLSLEAVQQSPEVPVNEDMPILPAAPPGHSLRRSTRTTYRRGSTTKKGSERVPYSKRLAKAQAETDGEESPVSSPGTPAVPAVPADESFKLARIQTDPTPALKTLNFSRPARPTAAVPETSPNPTFDTILQGDSPNRSSAPPQTRQWQSRISSNGRSSIQIPPQEQTVPQIVETPPPPAEQQRPSSSPSPAVTPQTRLPERTSSHEPPTTSNTQSPQSSQTPQTSQSPITKPPAPTRPSARPGASATQVTQLQKQKNPQTLNDMSAHPSPLPGNNTRTDSLSFIPTLTEDRKADNRKIRDKKDETRKSSWGWLLGTEEKEKDKEKERKRQEELRASRAKITKPSEKSHDSTRLDVLQTSIDGGGRGRESLVLDRGEVMLQEERKKESARKISGDKKEKDGLFSSIFGGGKKKNEEKTVSKKHSARALSPEPRQRELIPDVDYNWTRFSILEERAIYRMAHMKLANPRRPLYSQVLLSNFMYSYLAKVQQMHPQMQLPASAQAQKQKKKEQPEEYSQYQRYQEQQQTAPQNRSHHHPQHHGQHSQHGDYVDDAQIYEYDNDGHDPRGSSSRGSKHSMDSVNGYGSGMGGHEAFYGGHSSFGDAIQADDDDDMW